MPAAGGLTAMHIDFEQQRAEDERVARETLHRVKEQLQHCKVGAKIYFLWYALHKTSSTSHMQLLWDDCPLS
jgi:hypothetical protein